MGWRAVTWQQVMRYVSIVTGVVGAFGLAATAKDAYGVFEPILPATHHFVDAKLNELYTALSDAQSKQITNLLDSLTATSRETQRMITNLSTDVLRTQISVARDSLALKRGQRIQQSNLFSRNPSDSLVKLQLDQMDTDITADDGTLRAMVCELNKRVTTGFIC